MNQVLTISCKLKVSASQAVKLDATLDAFAQALNWVNQNTPEKVVSIGCEPYLEPLSAHLPKD